MQMTGRLFLCARCRLQVLICSKCDRGQIYCAGACAKLARRASGCEAGRRYRRTRKGRFASAESSRRYRDLQKKVTHQGSLTDLPDALLLQDLAVAIVAPESCAIAPTSPTSSTQPCRFCGALCSEFVRFGYLGRWVARPIRAQTRRGSNRGHSP